MIMTVIGTGQGMIASQVLCNVTRNSGWRGNSLSREHATTLAAQNMHSVDRPYESLPIR